MSMSKHVKALLQSHIAGDDERFLSAATQAAAHEARLGHSKVAEDLRLLIDAARNQRQKVGRRGKGPVPLARPRGELAGVLDAHYSDLRLSTMVLSSDLEAKLNRVVTEQRQRGALQSHGLFPRRKLLLVGPPGSGKTMTALALAGELSLPLFTVQYEILISKLMGETAKKLRLVFDAIREQRGVYVFDEFDAIGTQRAGPNDVGEIRRVLTSFLQMLERDDGDSLVIAATNHPELLDRALFRRFDEVIEYGWPSADVTEGIFRSRLAGHRVSIRSWKKIVAAADGLSQADVSRAADDAAKQAILSGADAVLADHIVSALSERRAVSIKAQYGRPSA